MTGTLTELATRIEQAEGPSRDLDAEIHHAIGRRDQQWADAPAYTASLDAAMTLVPTDITLMDMALTWEPKCPEAWPAVSITWYPPDKSGTDWHALFAKGATPALALCAAALRARGAA